LLIANSSHRVEPRRWLSGFAYHIDLNWWVFAAGTLDRQLHGGGGAGEK